jgi:predicted O-methyltransferase YrrM
LLASGLKGPEAKMYAIDNFIGKASNPAAENRYKTRMSKLNVDNTKDIFDNNIAHFGLESRVTAIVADSQVAAKNFCEPMNCIDLLFIDGDHSEEATKSDIIAWLPYIKQGGIIVFHDFTSNHGVPQAVWWAINQSYFSELIGVYGTTIAFRAH